MSLAVVIPAHNEAESIADVVASACRQVQHVIVVDDASTDGTAERLAGLPITLLPNDQNAGKGASLWSGMQAALASGAGAVITLDGDGQHRPEDIPRLVAEAARSPDRIVIAARRRGSSDAPRLRRFANRFADFWISWAAGYPITDSQSGFRLYPAELLRKLHIPHDRTRSFVWESEVLIEAARLGWLSAPVTVDAIYRPGGRPSHYRPAADTARIVRLVALKLIRRGMNPLNLLRGLGLLPVRE